MSNVNSPEMKMVMNFLGGNKISAEQAVRNICAKKGIDVNTFLNQLR